MIKISARLLTVLKVAPKRPVMKLPLVLKTGRMSEIACCARVRKTSQLMIELNFSEKGPMLNDCVASDLDPLLQQWNQVEVVEERDQL